MVSTNKGLLTGPQFTTTFQREASFYAWKALKSVFTLGSAPDPIGKAHDAPPDKLVAWGAS